jgi:hypothetical protein
MTKFRILAWTGHNVDIEVVDSVKEFNHRLHKVYKIKGRAEACCLHTYDRSKDKNVGKVLFCAKKLDINSISHELTHIMTGIIAAEGWNFMNEKHNEKIAWTLGYLVEECCHHLRKRGFTIKFSQDY